MTFAPILTQYSSHLSALVLAQTSVNYDIVNLYGIHFFVATWFHCFLTSHPIFVNVANALFWHMSGLNTGYCPINLVNVWKIETVLYKVHVYEEQDNKAKMSNSWLTSSIPLSSCTNFTYHVHYTYMYMYHSYTHTYTHIHTYTHTPQ